MRRAFSSLQIKLAVPPGTTPIAVGLAILLAAALCPGLPAVAGMALVALGATQVTLTRFCGTAAIVPVTFLHLATYGGLYALFVGATLHAATTRPNAIWGVASFLDIALSIVPIGLALQNVWCQLHGDRPDA